MDGRNVCVDRAGTGGLVGVHSLLIGRDLILARGDMATPFLDLFQVARFGSVIWPPCPNPMCGLMRMAGAVHERGMRCGRLSVIATVPIALENQ